MHKVTAELDRYGSRVRVEGAFADGFPQAMLSAVLFTGNQRELVTVGVDVRVDGPDVTYRVMDTANGLAFLRLVERDLVVADTRSGLAMVTKTGDKVVSERHSVTPVTGDFDPDFGQHVVFTRAGGTVVAVNGRAPDGGVEDVSQRRRFQDRASSERLRDEMVAYLAMTEAWLQKRREQHSATRGGWD